MKARSIGSLVLSLSCLCAAPAFAQGEPDHGGWLDEDQDPLSPKAAPAPAPEPTTAPLDEDELTPAERRKRSRTIDRNYNEAQKTYNEVLSKDPTGPLERRIKNNERIVTEFQGRIQTATTQRRQSQVDLYNRTFFLKQQLDKKQITPDVYDRLIREEEQKFQTAESNYKVNVVAWQKEVDVAQARLKDLRAQHRLLEAQKPRRMKPRRQRGGAQAEGPEGPKGSALVGNLRSRLQRLAHFRRRHTMVGVHPRSLGRPVLSTPAVADEE